MPKETVPVVAIRRSDRGNLNNLLHPVRTRSLLNKGARVLLIGGTAKIMPDVDNVVHDLYEVVADRSEDPIVARTAGELMVGSVLNTYRYDNNHPRLPTLNDIRVREASSKDRVYTKLLPDISPRTVIATSASAVEQAQDELSAASKLVVKPVRGMRGRGVLGITHPALQEELIRRFTEAPDDAQVIQERIATQAWPQTIHAADSQEEPRLHGAKKQELRLFLVNGLLVPIARVIDPTDEQDFNHPADAYVALDANTVPHEVYAIGEEARAKTQQASGVDELAIAVDLMYGERPSSGYGQPGWYLSEVNSIDPQFPSIAQYPHLAWQLNNARSDQLIRMAGY